MRRNQRSLLLTIIIFLIVNHSVFSGAGKETVIIDTCHYSSTFGEIRNFRIFIPPGYYTHPDKRYPVIYFFHGWSQRYFGPVGDDYSNYDAGDDNKGDNIANYVASHDVIVVKPDGFNPLSDSAYELTPYNEYKVTTWRQFPLYFRELVELTDNNYRTFNDRGHRAVCGLSMGGFMSWWVAGKYPDMVSAAGNFCGSSEFMAGPLSIPVEYKILDLYNNYRGVNLRFNYGIRDNLRYFHLDMDRVWREIMDNYRLVAYDAAHSTCGLGDMFDFCLSTFANPPGKPAKWNHTDLYPDFSVWDYEVTTDRFRPGFTILEEVDERGFNSSVREFMPDGELMPYVNMVITTAPLYAKSTEYLITDFDQTTLKSSSRSLYSDNRGRLKFNLNGGKHYIGISLPKGSPDLTIESVNITNPDQAADRKKVDLQIKILNKGTSAAEGVNVKLKPVKDYVRVTGVSTILGTIPSGSDSADPGKFSVYVDSDSAEFAKFILTLNDKKGNEWSESFELPVRVDAPELTGFEIADGRTITVVKAGILTQTLQLGTGNGDGIPNPGESIVIVAKENGKNWRTLLNTKDKFVNPGGINIRHTDLWDQFGGVGSSPKYSIPVISSDCPAGHKIEFYAEYWIPENKFNIIKKGVLSITVGGKDVTPPVTEWVNISGRNRLQVKVCDGGRIASVKAKLIPVADVKGLDDISLKCPDKPIEADLGDDGTNGDLAASDRVFSKIIDPPATCFYRVDVITTDQYGNSATYSDPGVYLVHRN